MLTELFSLCLYSCSLVDVTNEPLNLCVCAFVCVFVGVLCVYTHTRPCVHFYRFLCVCTSAPWRVLPMNLWTFVCVRVCVFVGVLCVYTHTPMCTFLRVVLSLYPVFTHSLYFSWLQWKPYHCFTSIEVVLCCYHWMAFLPTASFLEICTNSKKEYTLKNCSYSNFFVMINTDTILLLRWNNQCEWHAVTCILMVIRWHWCL